MQTILQVAIPSPLYRLFDYLAPAGLGPAERGMRVRVPFGRREVVGVVMGVSDQSDCPRDKLKPVLAVLDDEPLLPNELLSICEWMSRYYHHSLGEVVSAAMPKWLRNGRLLETIKLGSPDLPDTVLGSLSLNDDQQKALDAIIACDSHTTFLLDGVTGSGKTEVYLQAIAHSLHLNKQALILVPEISLAPQTVARFRARFSVPMAVLHSRLSEGERAKAWCLARSGVARIVIGTRSALFTPMPDLGLIVIDEEHDASFKQQSGCRYSARDVAILRARKSDIPIVLGSATPSLATVFNAKQGRFKWLTLPKRVGRAVLPDIQCIDMRSAPLEHGLSQALLSAIDRHLSAGNQVLVFLNRRGFAPVLLCHHCGWTAVCGHCDRKLTLHTHPHRLSCHHCGFSRVPPKICESCQQAEVISVGLGTEQLADFLSERFPSAPLMRIDRDSTQKKGSFEAMRQAINDGEVKLLVGTQMLAKGHHFEQLSLVAVVNADGALYSADFSAEARMAQTLIQVAGRAGRDCERGEVLIQTHQPDHPTLKAIRRGDYAACCERYLVDRQSAALPPVSAMAIVRAESTTRQVATDFLSKIALLFQKEKQSTLGCYGPMPALMERMGGRYREELVLIAPNKSLLQQAVTTWLAQWVHEPVPRNCRWALDVDPF